MLSRFPLIDGHNDLPWAIRNTFGDLAALDLTQPAAVTALGKEMTGPWTTVQRVTGPPSADANAASVDAKLRAAWKNADIALTASAF